MDKPDERREEACDRLSQETVRWIMRQLDGVKGTGYKGMSELQNDIYGWLREHAIFRDPFR